MPPVKHGVALGRDVALDALRKDYDAVFLGVGLSGTNKLGLAGEGDLANVVDAVEYIAELRQASDLTKLPVGRRVVVIGGGMTAVDAAVQSKRLGAETVTIAYRRGIEDMKASRYERELAQTNGVAIRPWARPIALEGHGGAVSGVLFERTGIENGALVGVGGAFRIEADVVFTAIGQTGAPGIFGAEAPALKDGKLVVDDERRTSLKGVWAGGDCVAGGLDLTVERGRGRQAGGALDHRGAAQLKEVLMVDLRAEFLGIKSPNPFWLASAPPTDRKTNVERAFRAGWGGVVWKTLGEAGPPVVNVSGARYGAHARPGPAPDRLQQYRADHRPRSRDQPAGDQAGQARLARPRAGRLADGALRGGRLEEDPRPRRGDRVRRRRAQFRLSARHVASAAWARRSARCPNTSRWSRAGARRIRACRSSSS